jgi:hypothetical protein
MLSSLKPLLKRCVDRFEAVDLRPQYEATMKKFLRRLTQDIIRGENIDLLITVVLALGISILNTLGMAPSSLSSSITLAVLGLIAIGLLATRYRIDEIGHRGDLPDTVHFARYKADSFMNDFSNAKEICMLGFVLRGTIAENFYTLKQSVGEGVKIRTMILDPKKADMDKMVKHFTWATHSDLFRVEYEQMINRYKQIYSAASNPDNVQLRLLDFMPHISLYIFPKRGDNGVLYVEMYGYRSDSSIPKFRITERDNPNWYKHFTNQFEYR